MSSKRGEEWDELSPEPQPERDGPGGGSGKSTATMAPKPPSSGPQQPVMRFRPWLWLVRIVLLVILFYALTQLLG